jgi:hypothetical protein
VTLESTKVVIEKMHRQISGRPISPEISPMMARRSLPSRIDLMNLSIFINIASKRLSGKLLS